MKKNQKTKKIQITTIIFGYTAFAVMIAAVILGTVIPIGQTLLHPDVKHINVILLAISLISSALLPPLLSYIIGDRVTHGKDKLAHHFNGILFGVAAYWIVLVIGIANAHIIENIPSVVLPPINTLLFGWPIVATIIIMAIVAAIYAHQKHTTMLYNRPLQIVLFGSFIILYLSNIFDMLQQESTTYLLESAAYCIVPLLVVGISYWLLSLRTFSSSEKSILAISGTTFGLIFYTNIAAMIPNTIGSIIGVVCGLSVALAYAYILRRA